MRKSWTFGLLLAIFFGATVNTDAEAVRGRLLIRDDVPVSHRTELVNRLRVITGWRDLRFDNNGMLSWNRDAVDGGSQSARALITSLVSADAMIVIQDASSRSDVAFCRVVPGRLIRDELPSLRAFVVLIDFADFHQVTGDRQARDAFDVGWGLLHEVNHVVNDSDDARRPDQIGDCEDEINHMRSELDLPIRTTYFYSPMPIKNSHDFPNRLVRLAFEKRDSVANRTRRYWLIWDATTVGGLEQGQTAFLR